MHKKGKITFFIILAIGIALVATIAIFELFKTCGDCGKPHVQELSQENTAKVVPLQPADNFTASTLIYSRNNGSVPPPYYSNYVLTVTKDSAGVIKAIYERKDYKGSVLLKKNVSLSDDQFVNLMSKALVVGKDKPNLLSGCTGGSNKSLKILEGEKVVLETSSYSCAFKATNQSLEDFSTGADDLAGGIIY